MVHFPWLKITYFTSFVPFALPIPDQDDFPLSTLFLEGDKRMRKSRQTPVLSEIDECWLNKGLKLFIRTREKAVWVALHPYILKI